MPIESWAHDLRFACRALRNAPAFTATAVLTLALGIAGATLMFALVEGVVLRRLPVREQDRLFVAWKDLPSGGNFHQPYRRREIETLRDESRLLQAVGGVGYNGAMPSVAVENGAASSVNTVCVTGSFFEVLGAPPVLGRVLRPSDDVRGAENVLVITHGLWQRRYGGAPDVIGRLLTVDEQPFRIVGVMPQDVAYPPGVEAWMTVAAMASTVTNAAFREGVERDFDLLARLRPEATLEQAKSEIEALVARLEAQAPPGEPRGTTPVVHGYADAVVGDTSRALVLLFAAVGLVLLAACANVANLLLLRGESRQGELAVRAALGARPGRLAGPLLAEALVLAILAGAGGLAAASAALPALLSLLPDTLPRLESVRLDLGGFLFTAAVTSVVAVLAALVPARRTAHVDLVAQLRLGRPVGGGGVQRGRRALVVAQVALAVTVVAGAGLLTRSLHRLQTVDMGLADDRLAFASLVLPQAKYAEPERHHRFLEALLADLRGTPGVEAATPVNTLPFAGTGGWDLPAFTAEGQSVDRALENPALNLESVHPGYFATLAVPIVRGRAFTEADRAGAPEVAIVSEDVAARAWPGEDPIGKRLKFGAAGTPDPWRTVVGVARPTRYRELRQPRPTLYLSARQFVDAANIIVLRTTAPLASLAPLVRARTEAIDPDVKVMRIAPFSELVAGPLARPRFNTLVISLFAAAVLLLAAVGVGAVMGAFVRQRRPEIGVRVALGATAADVFRLVLGEGLKLAAQGALLGLLGAVSAARVLRSLLFEVQPLDAPSLLGAALGLVSTSALATYLPARRAARADPLAVLKSL